MRPNVFFSTIFFVLSLCAVVTLGICAPAGGLPVWPWGIMSIIAGAVLPLSIFYCVFAFLKDDD